MKTTFHVHLDVRGALERMSSRELDGMFRYAKTGKPLDAAAARQVLRDHLAAGRVVIPMAPDCDGFDFQGGGCPGHTAAEPDGEHNGEARHG